MKTRCARQDVALMRRLPTGAISLCCIEILEGQKR